MTLFKAPNFWNSNSILSKVFLPLSWVYLLLVRLNQRKTTPVKLSVPVICVGNLVMGGAGKTPTVIALIDILKEMGHTPHIISRGYGAIVKGLKQVDPSRHHYLQVGDEPLMLSKVAPTWVSPNRVKAGRAAIQEGATILVMDDGFQNNTIKKDFNIIVVDAIQKFGNKKLFPAGPLREPLKEGLKKADAVVVIGDKKPEDLDYISNCVQGHFKPKTTPDKPLERVIAFAGLGYPEKFKISLQNAGYKVVEFITYPDHYPYTITELERLVKKAHSKRSKLITTSKDAIRLPSHYREKVNVFKINLEFDNIEYLKQKLEEKIVSIK